jgi:hypothetical protein
MKPTAKKIFSALLLSLAATCLPAQSPFGNLPLWFEAAGSREFTARGAHAEFTVTERGAKFTLQKPGGKPSVCTMQFVGAGPAGISGVQPLTAKINRLFGSHPGQWQMGVPVFGRVQLENVYPGVDVVFYGNQEMLEYDFYIAAGADVSAIALRFAGAEKVSVNPQGSLVIRMSGGEVIQHPPVAYQTVRNARQEVTVRYRMLDRQTVAFVVGAHDRTLPLVIDPVVSYASFFGGNRGDTAWAVAVNPGDSSIYIAGQTFSSQFSNDMPFSTTGAPDASYGGGKWAGDAFVARFDSSGTNLIYATYLGGSQDDAAYALAVDAAGNAYVAGSTASSNFPIINPFPGGGRIHGPRTPQLNKFPTDAFVAQLDPSGSNLLYSTFIGGNSAEVAYGIALDPANNAYITGFTYSTNFPVTPDAFQDQLACSNTVYFNANAFVSKIGAGDGSLAYSTYLGGTNFDVGRAVAFNNNRLFIAGYTFSTNFPATNILAGFDRLNGNTRTNKNYKHTGISDAFVTAFDASGASLAMLYSSFLGGTNNDVANAIAADAAGNAYVAGHTMSTNFPVTPTNAPWLTSAFVYTNDFKKHFKLATNAFLTKIAWDGSQPSIGYSTMFGGKGVNVANGLALDAAGNAYVAGSANCTNFPVTPDNLVWPLTATNSSKKKNDQHLSDVFVMAFNPDCTALLYSGYLGGRDSDYGNAITVDASGVATIVGQTLSTNFPTVNPGQTFRNGTNDMFVAQILPDAPPTLTIAPLASASAVQAKVAGQAPAAVRLKWRTFPVGYGLETCGDITRTNWQVVPQHPAYTNGWYQLDFTPTGSVQFFRLRKP